MRSRANFKVFQESIMNLTAMLLNWTNDTQPSSASMLLLSFSKKMNLGHMEKLLISETFSLFVRGVIFSDLCLFQEY